MNKFFAILFILSISNISYADFSGNYAPGNWTQDLNGGSLDFSGAPASIMTISSNDGAGPDETDLFITAPANGTVSFDWSYLTSDAFDDAQYDPFGWLLNGVFTQVTDDLGLVSQNGTVTFSVNAGDVFGFRALATDSIFGSATTTITNFSAPLPTAASIPSLSAWSLAILVLTLFAVGRRKL